MTLIQQGTTNNNNNTNTTTNNNNNGANATGNDSAGDGNNSTNIKVKNNDQQNFTDYGNQDHGPPFDHPEGTFKKYNTSNDTHVLPPHTVARHFKPGTDTFALVKVMTTCNTPQPEGRYALCVNASRKEINAPQQELCQETKDERILNIQHFDFGIADYPYNQEDHGIFPAQQALWGFNSSNQIKGSVVTQQLKNLVLHSEDPLGIKQLYEEVSNALNNASSQTTSDIMPAFKDLQRNVTFHDILVD